MKKLIKIALISLGAILVLALVSKKMGWSGKEKVTKVSTAKVEKRTLVEKVPASGKIQPETEVLISPEVSGEIVGLYVQEGDAVKKGQMLVKINPSVYESAIDRVKASLNSAEANLAVSKAQLIDTELKYKRSVALHKTGAISDAEFETQQSQYDVAKLNVQSAQFQVNSAKASLQEAEENLRRTQLIAPMDGIVSSLNVELGERVVGTAQMAGTELLRIADLSKMEVVVEVNENEIIKVQLGDEVEIEVDAYLDEKFKGEVTEIASSANLLSTSPDQVTNFEVKIRILESSYNHLSEHLAPGRSPFRPGMTATVDILTNKKENVLTLPIKAVTTRKDTSSTSVSRRERRKAAMDESMEEEKAADEAFECVFQIAESKAKLQVVETGIQDNKYIEIVSGLNEGDEVITGPYSAVSKTLKTGVTVVVVSESQLFETMK